MANKQFFWERKKKYYEFPLWMRMLRGVFSVAWTGVKVAFGAALVALGIVLVAGVVFGCQLADYLQDDVIPNSDFELEGITLDQSSFIYCMDRDENISLMQQIYTNVNRVWVPYDEIPQDLVHAAVAIEDKRFFQHQGVDWFRTTGACINMFLGGGSSFGGSTITQQLIKNLTEEDDVTVRRKITEIFRALKFEETYTKEVVMEWYLNTIYLGENCYGVQTAARTYFGKDAKDLTAAECASIISITNNPSLYDPYISMDRNRKRQVTVLDEMHSQGYLTDEEYEQALDQQMRFTSVGLDDVLYTCENCGMIGSVETYEYHEDSKHYSCPNCGAAMDIEDTSDSEYYSYFTDTVIRDVCDDLMEKYGYSYDVCMQMIKTGGYHIYTTIDMEVQKIVDSVYQDLERIPTTNSSQQLQSAIVVIDNSTGDIVAMAGGVGKKQSYLGWNRATQSTLQPGSSIKPLSVYTPALEMGLINPATRIFDGPLYDDYPHNYDFTYSGNTIVLDGLGQSMNTVACRVERELGDEASFDFAKNRYGLSTLIESEFINGSDKTDISLAPLAMGALTYGVTVRDLTTAYATFSNDGVWREARTYLKVLDSDGNVVLDNTQDMRQIISHKTVNYINYMLKYAVDSNYSPARLDGMPVAGKTGTTSDDNDRWFAGYTPYYTAAVWCGFDQPETIHLTGNTNNPSARLWNMVMEPLHEPLEYRSIYNSSELVTVEICSESGLLATDLCRADPRKPACVMRCALYPEDVPSKSCNVHVEISYCVAGKAEANEYCSQIKDNKVETRGYVKLTPEMAELYKAARIDYSGFAFVESGDGKTCTLHTKQMLEEQQQQEHPVLDALENLLNPTKPTEAP